MNFYTKLSSLILLENLRDLATPNLFHTSQGAGATVACPCLWGMGSSLTLVSTPGPEHSSSFPAWPLRHVGLWSLLNSANGKDKCSKMTVIMMLTSNYIPLAIWPALFLDLFHVHSHLKKIGVWLSSFCRWSTLDLANWGTKNELCTRFAFWVFSGRKHPFSLA